MLLFNLRVILEKRGKPLTIGPRLVNKIPLIGDNNSSYINNINIINNNLGFSWINCRLFFFTSKPIMQI